MLASANQNKPLHFFRRFAEGWFSVYLSIFLLTLAVRLLFFAPEAPAQKNTAMAHPRIQTKHILRYSFRSMGFYGANKARAENATSFGGNKTD